MHQINEIIHDAVGDDAEIIFGAVHEPAMQGEIRVTVIATGFDSAENERQVINHDFRRPRPQPTTRTTPQRPAVSKVKQMDIESEIAHDSRPDAEAPRRVAVGGGASFSVEPAPRLGRMPGRPVSSREIGELDIPTFIRRQMD